MNATIVDTFWVSGRGLILQGILESGEPQLGPAALRLPDGTFTKVTVTGLERSRDLTSLNRWMKTVGFIIRESIDTEVFPLKGAVINQPEVPK